MSACEAALQIVLQIIVGKWFNDHPDAVFGQRLSDMLARADGVAHVVLARLEDHVERCFGSATEARETCVSHDLAAWAKVIRLPMPASAASSLARSIEGT